MFALTNELLATVPEEGDEEIARSNTKNTQLLLTYVDSNMYSLIKSLCSPDNPTTKTINQIRTAVCDHINPKANKHTQRYVFSETRQLHGQSVNEFIAKLREIAEDCEFEHYESRMLDQFIAGLKNERMKQRLLCSDQLTFSVAIRKAVAEEQSAKEAQIMSGNSQSKEVNKVKTAKSRYKNNFQIANNTGKSPNVASSSKQDSVVVCAKCKLNGHYANKCRTRCYGCKAIGHTKKNCYQKKNYKAHHVSGSDEDSFVEERVTSEGNWDNFPVGIHQTTLVTSHNFHVKCDSMNDLIEIDSNVCNSNLLMNDSNKLSKIDSKLYSCIEITDNLVNLSNDNNEKIDAIDSVINNTDNIVSESRISIDHSEFEPEPNKTMYCKFVESRQLMQVELNGKYNLSMEFDSGSQVSCCSIDALVGSGMGRSFLQTLAPSSKSLKVANGDEKEVLGKLMVKVKFNGTVKDNLTIYVVKGQFPSLMGVSWITVFLGRDWLDRLLKSARGSPSSSSVCSVASESSCIVVKPDSPMSSGNNSLVSLSSDKDPFVSLKNTDSSVSSFSHKDPLVSSEKSDSPRGTLDEKLLSEEEWLTKVSEGVSKITEQDIERCISNVKQNKVFQPGLGMIKGIQAKLVRKKNAQPVFHKARPVPFADRGKVEERLDDMENSGVTMKVESSDWGSPIVIVKKNGKMRICGDYKATLNPNLETKHYPLPSIEDCFNEVSGGQKFTVIDIRSAYNHILVREEDRPLTTINTHKGLYQYNRLPYGVNNSGPIFQETIDNTLFGTKMTCCRVDDILISGKTPVEHLLNLIEVIKRLEIRGFKCSLEKCKFYQDKVVYLGHEVSAEGIRPVRSKVEDMLKAPAPKDLDSLISFLGAVNYYRRYLPDLATIVAPLDALRTSEWKWTSVEEEAFKELKKLLSSDRVLTLYDPKKKLMLDTDASSVGLGAVLSHYSDAGEEHPIEFASRTLSKTERRYSQIDREALGIVWAIKKFHLYLYGNRFKLRTDHKPLTYIFHPEKKLPEMTANRLTRWALLLMNYDYEIEYRNTKQHANCDALSRLPKAVKHEEEEDDCANVFSVSMEEVLLDASLVAAETRKDHVLSKVLLYIMEGWPVKLENPSLELTEMSKRKLELSVELGCITWGTRVVVPNRLRKTVLEMLHLTHVGMTGMKMLARSYVWWPNLNGDIEALVKTCSSCNKHGKSLPSLEDHPWCKPSGPWQRVHMDYCGEFLGHMWLVLQDAYSKWPEIKLMHSTKAGPTIKALRSIFSRTGIPCVVVSDQGRQFIADEMKNFMKANNIRFILAPTYHPKSNGLAERLVQTFKLAMKKMYEQNKDLHQNLDNFLITYRNTPHSVTGSTPAILMYNRPLRSQLQQLSPSDKMKVEALQPNKQERLLNSKTPESRQFKENQPVYVKIDKNSAWTEGKILSRSAPNSNVYEIESAGRKILKHADHLKSRLVPVISLINKGSMGEGDKARLRSMHNTPTSSTVIQGSHSLNDNHTVMTKSNVNSGRTQSTVAPHCQTPMLNTTNGNVDKPNVEPIGSDLVESNTNASERFVRKPVLSSICETVSEPLRRSQRTATKVDYKKFY